MNFKFTPGKTWTSVIVGILAGIKRMFTTGAATPAKSFMGALIVVGVLVFVIWSLFQKKD